MAKVITSLSELPERVQGKGERADLYDTFKIDDKVKFAFLNDIEFNKVIDHNTKRLLGPEANCIFIENEGDEFGYMIIRKSAVE